MDRIRGFSSHCDRFLGFDDRLIACSVDSVYQALFSISGPLLRTLPTSLLAGVMRRFIWAQQIERRPRLIIVIEPSVEVPRVQDNGHAVVDRFHQLIFFGGYDRESIKRRVWTGGVRLREGDAPSAFHLLVATGCYISPTMSRMARYEARLLAIKRIERP
jgi:hypothetical protein